MSVAVALVALAAAHPATLDFERLPWPADRRPQARIIARFLEAVAREETAAFETEVLADAVLAVDGGNEARLDQEAFARLLEGCERVWDFSIPLAKDRLGVTWKCGAKLRNASFSFAGDKVAKVHFLSNYVVAAPPPPPPPPTGEQLAQARERRAAVGMVREHFLLLARKDPVELATFYERVGAIPVAGSAGVSTLGEYYRREMADDGREVALRGCYTAPNEASGEVRCRLSIERAGDDRVAAVSVYLLTYVVKAGRIERVAVTLQPTPQPGTAD